MSPKKFIAIACCVGLAGAATAQNRRATLGFIQKGDLTSALTSVQQTIAGPHADGGDYQIQGLLLVGQGKTALALVSFIEGLKRATNQPLPTGLENLPPDSAFNHQLQLIKGVFTVSNGQAAFHNNIGLTLLILGKMRDGFAELSQVSRLAPASGEPYLNEAVGHLLKSEGSLAVTAAKKALNHNLTTPMTRAVLAEADLMVNRTSEAHDQLQWALSDQPNHPYALAAMAQYDAQLGDARGAQRYRAKALTFGGPLVVNGVVAPSYTDGAASGGNANESHYLVDQRLFPAKLGLGASLLLNGDNQRVQDRGNAYQSLTNGQGELGDKLSALHLDYKDLDGGRPGPTVFEPGVVSDPTAVVAFHQTNVYGVRKIGPVELYAGYRSSNANLNDAGNPLLSHNNDTQFAEEARYDFPKWGGTTTTGIAFSQLNRSLTGPLVIDPTEELLPAGQTDLWTSYAMHTRQLNKLTTLKFGGVLGGNGAALILEPYLDLGLKLGPTNILHVGVTSNFNSDVGNLMPEEMRAPDPLDNTVDRNQQSTTVYDRSPLLLGQQGRQQTYAATLNTQLKHNISLNTTAFHHDLKDFTIQGTDPQTATYINQNQFSSGQATGISETVNVGFTPTIGLRIHAYAQQTHMAPAMTLFNGNQPGVAAPTDLPFFPNIGLDVGFDVHGSDWTGTLVASTLGRRTVATGVPMGDNQLCCSYIETVNPVTSWNLFVHKQAGRFEVYAAIYNVTKVSFYPGDPGRTTVVMGLQL